MKGGKAGRKAAVAKLLINRALLPLNGEAEVRKKLFNFSPAGE